jgi:hypothetical protein
MILSADLLCSSDCGRAKPNREDNSLQREQQGEAAPTLQDAEKLFVKWFTLSGRSLLRRMGIFGHDQDDIIQCACLAYWKTYVVGRVNVAFPHAVMTRIVRREAMRKWGRGREPIAPREMPDQAAPDIRNEVDAFNDFRELLQLFSEEPQTDYRTVEAIRVWVESGGPKYVDVAAMIGTSPTKVRGAIFSFTRWVRRRFEQ